MQTGLPEGLHLVTSCENSQYQPVQVGSNAADVSTHVGPSLPAFVFALPPEPEEGQGYHPQPRHGIHYIPLQTLCTTDH